MAGQLASGLYFILNVASKTAISFGGEPVDVNPVQGFRGLTPPLGDDPAHIWAVGKYEGSDYYYLWNVYHPNFMFMNSTAPSQSQIYIGPGDRSIQQDWIITPHQNWQRPTYYTLVNRATNKQAELYGGSASQGTPIRGTVQNDNKASQAWLFIPA